MRFRLAPMTEEHARAVASWRYPGEYAFYDLDRDEDDLSAFMDPAGWGETEFSVLDEAGDLVGFFAFAEHFGSLLVGLGMRPDLTGKGLGSDFVEAGLAFARERFAPHEFRMAVAAWNRRAIRAYEKVGFRVVGSRTWRTGGEDHEFVDMARPAED